MPVDSENLINAVYRRVPLWDKKNKHYHNRFIIDKNWDEVSKEFNEEKEILKKKWKQLRDAFRAELKKNPIERSGDPGSEDESNSSWQYFKMMLFLKDQMKSRPIKTKNFSIEEEELSDGDNERNINAIGIATPNSSRKMYLKRRKQKFDNANNTELINVKKRKLELLEKESQSTRETDEDIAFFESLLSHVRSMDAPKKLLCRMEIQQIVYNYAYRNNHSSSSPWPVTSETTASTNSQYTKPQFSSITKYELEIGSAECQNSYSHAAELQPSAVVLQDNDGNEISFT